MSKTLEGPIQYRESMTWVTVGGQFPSRAQQRTINIDGVPIGEEDRAQVEAERLGAPAGTVPSGRLRLLRPTHVDLTWQWIDYETAELMVEPS